MTEERIFVEKVEKEHFPLCVACWSDGEDYFCSWDGEDKPTNKEICEKKCPYDHTITRLDAIERIAEALCRKDSGIKSCHECTYNGTANCGYTLNKWFSEDAEAALNAFLEVEK